MVGTRPSTTPILSRACRESSMVSPSESMLPRKSGAPGNLQACAEEKKEKQAGHHYAYKTKFLSDYGQDEISIGFRQIEEFLLAGSKSLSEKSARPDRYPCLDELVSGIKGVEPGIEKSLPAGSGYGTR